MNEDIENCSVIGNSNFRDCRPIGGDSSLFTNSTIAEKANIKSTMSQGSHAKSTLATGGNQTSLAINKTAQEKEFGKRQLQDKYSQHLNKVMNRKHTLTQSGVNTMRTVKNGTLTDHQGSGIIKTVILPNEEINRLAIEAEELKQYLQASKLVFEESVAAFDKDRLIREQEYKMKD